MPAISTHYQPWRSLNLARAHEYVLAANGGLFDIACFVRWRAGRSKSDKVAAISACVAGTQRTTPRWGSC